jgi:hypothetical protein
MCVLQQYGNLFDVIFSPQKVLAAGRDRFACEFSKTLGFDAAKIALSLLDPHPKIPDIGLSRSDAAELAAILRR